MFMCKEMSISRCHITYLNSSTLILFVVVISSFASPILCEHNTICDRAGDCSAAAPAAAAGTEPVRNPDTLLTDSDSKELAYDDPGRGTALKPVMRHIPTHEFQMGSKSSDPQFVADGESPTCQVLVDAFKMDAYAITNAQFADFVAATGYVTEAEEFGWSFVFDLALQQTVKDETFLVSRAKHAPWWIAVDNATWLHPLGVAEGTHCVLDSSWDLQNHPVVHVSFRDAQQFCQWRGARLPTEAEWEAASRGGKHARTFPWGNILTPRGRHYCNIWQGVFPHSNTQDDGFVFTAPVDSFRPNGFGLYNMVGNVWEWTTDWFHHKRFAHQQHFVNADGVLVNPQGPIAGTARVKKGGSFMVC
jgi:formylglycine-generating enzyme